MRKFYCWNDDVKLAQEIQKYFVMHSYTCDIVYDGAMLIKQRKIQVYNLYILDVNVPLYNGLEVCKIIRGEIKPRPLLC